MVQLLLRLLQYDCRALFSEEDYDSDYDAAKDDSDDDDDDLRAEYELFGQARCRAYCASLFDNRGNSEAPPVMLPAIAAYLGMVSPSIARSFSATYL